MLFFIWRSKPTDVHSSFSSVQFKKYILWDTWGLQRPRWLLGPLRGWNPYEEAVESNRRTASTSTRQADDQAALLGTSCWRCLIPFQHHTWVWRLVHIPHAMTKNLSVRIFLPYFYRKKTWMLIYLPGCVEGICGLCRGGGGGGAVSRFW